jgi:hypothetical protein
MYAAIDNADTTFPEEVAVFILSEMPVAVSLRSYNMRMYQWYDYLWEQWI